MEEVNEISDSIRGGEYICYVASLIPDDFIDSFFSVYLILPAALWWPWS
jgi:hypothetical protein